MSSRKDKQTDRTGFNWSQHKLSQIENDAKDEYWTTIVVIVLFFY